MYKGANISQTDMVFPLQPIYIFTMVALCEYYDPILLLACVHQCLDGPELTIQPINAPSTYMYSVPPRTSKFDIFFQ